jgi:hypothetical protein
MTQGRKSSKKEEPTLIEMSVKPYADMYRMSKRVVNKAIKSFKKARRSRL